MKVLTVIGARPQFVKAATVSRAMAQQHWQRLGLTEVRVHTGQHFDKNMSQIFFDELDIPPPDYHLGITHPSHGGMTGRMLERIDEIIRDERPDHVLVYGDTNSTLAGALAAVKLHVPVAHVEAGLRSFNRKMPEEINRVLTDHASELLFAPTQTAIENLAREGIDACKVHLTGDVMYDASLFYGNKAEQYSDILVRLNLRPQGYMLATCHRAENTDDPSRLEAVFKGMIDVAEDTPILLPLHPRTRQALLRHGLLGEVHERLRVIDPVGYLDMLMLEKHASVIATDSGGVQKEAFFFRVPCITLRDETEWTELVDSGWNRLLSPGDADSVATGIRESLGHRGEESSPYGDGQSARHIVELLMQTADTQCGR